MREIVFDTETTGLSARDGDRVIELGAVELENRFPTGRSFHHYINPDGRSVHPEALAVHGLDDKFLAGKPVFAEIAGEFLEFVGTGLLVAHNASFDMGFLNAELDRIGMPSIAPDRVVDTLMIARRRHPMGPNSLDALCQRYGIDNTRRTKHGALLDSELLAEVYIELNGGRQASLLLDRETENGTDTDMVDVSAGERRRRPTPLPSRLGASGREKHRAFIATLGDKALWDSYD